MDQRVSLITLAVEDLAAERAFYEALGWEVTDATDDLVVFDLNVRTAAEVQPVLDAADAAGATVLRDAHEMFWGGTVGFFLAPAGHLWEVAHNPHAPLAADGRFRWRGYGDES